MIAGTVYKKEKTPILSMNFSSLSVLVPPLFMTVLTLNEKRRRIQSQNRGFAGADNRLTRNREMNPPNRKMVPRNRKMQSGAKTNTRRADMSQTPTEQTPLSTSPEETRKEKHRIRTVNSTAAENIAKSRLCVTYSS